MVDAHEKKVVKKPDEVKKTDPVTTPGGTDDLKQKLGLTDKEIKGNKLYSFISEWYAVPYKYGGCVKTGVDCSCFATNLYQSVYGKSLARTAGDMFLQSDKISENDAREGDLVFFRMYGTKITHVGVFVKGDYFVHASTSKGVMLSSLQEAYYKKYFYCAGRIKKT